MQKYIPAFFIVLMTGLLGAKFALAEQAQAEAAERAAITYSLGE